MSNPPATFWPVRDLDDLERWCGRTAPQVMLERASAEADAVALRDKHLGIYEAYSWARYRMIVEEVACGLAELGVKRGDRVAIMGDPCPEWVFADMAVMALGGITVGVYPTSAPVEVEHVLNDSGSTILIAETQEHLDKVLSAIDRVPAIRRIVVVDMRALFLFEHPLLMPLDELRALGRDRIAREPDLLQREVAAGRADDAAAIVYTSGTTGPPKGAVLSHRNILAGALTYLNCSPDLAGIEHQVVAHLPLSHVVARIMFATLPLVSRVVPFFCEDIDDFPETIREVAPDFSFLPPRFYEKFAAQLLVGVETSTPLKRRAYRLAERVGRAVVRRRRAGQAVPALLGIAFFLARQLVLRHLLEKIGFGRIRRAFTGSAPMPPQVVDVWHAWGIDLREGYGVTECCGISLGQFTPFPAPGDIGTPAALPGFDFKLSEAGEILLRSPMVFVGYWNSPSATDEVKTADGWYHTGDVAERLPGGQIKLVDRLKDVFVTLGGKTLSPQQIEKVVRGSPFIAEAVAFGDGRRYVTALLELDYTTVSEWARSRRIAYTSYTNLVTRPEIATLIASEIEHANQFLARVEQIKAFRIIPVELDPEEGETTPTRKIKRGLMYRMFKDTIESMYADDQTKVFKRQDDTVPG